jgi:hypothetical protein
MPQYKNKKTKITKQDLKYNNKFAKPGQMPRKMGLKKPANKSAQRRAFLRLKGARSRKPRRKGRRPLHVTYRFFKLARARFHVLFRLRRLFTAHRKLGHLFLRRFRHRSVRRRHLEIRKRLSRICRSFWRHTARNQFNNIYSCFIAGYLQPVRKNVRVRRQRARFRRHQHTRRFSRTIRISLDKNLVTRRLAGFRAAAAAAQLFRKRVFSRRRRLPRLGYFTREAERQNVAFNPFIQTECAIRKRLRRRFYRGITTYQTTRRLKRDRKTGRQGREKRESAYIKRVKFRAFAGFFKRRR